MATDAKSHLGTLVAAHVLREVEAGEFTFEHALTREAVYSTLVRRERRQGHLAVAEILLGIYAGTPQFDAYLGEIAYHYEHAEAWTEAVIYARFAGEAAQAKYALREAIEHYSRALSALRHLDREPEPALLRARGQSLETTGSFTGAEADYSAALAAARASGDPAAEWQALLDLGLLWSGRDYARVGDYYEQALRVARALGDPAALAHSLNRLGNWRLNQGQPRQALKHHQEALSLFEGLLDQPGLASTFDYLGMASFLSGDMAAGTQYYERAVALFRALDDRVGLASSLATLSLRGPSGFTDTVVPAGSSDAAIRDGEAALALARATQNRPGEAYALIFLGQAEAAAGDGARALALAQAGLSLAVAIQHTQWQTLGHCTLGALLLDRAGVAQALPHLTTALALAQANRSVYWIDTTSAWLARAYLQSGTPEARELARAVLAAVVQEAPPQAMGQRCVWAALAELALADGDPALALRRLDVLLETGRAVASGGAAIPRLGRLRAEALRRLGQTEAARALLDETRAEARRQGLVTDLAHVDAALALLDAGQQPTSQPEG